MKRPNTWDIDYIQKYTHELSHMSKTCEIADNLIHDIQEFLRCGCGAIVPCEERVNYRPVVEENPCNSCFIAEKIRQTLLERFSKTIAQLLKEYRKILYENYHA